MELLFTETEEKPALTDYKELKTPQRLNTEISSFFIYLDEDNPDLKIPIFGLEWVISITIEASKKEIMRFPYEMAFVVKSINSIEKDLPYAIEIIKMSFKEIKESFSEKFTSILPLPVVDYQTVAAEMMELLIENNYYL